VARKPLISGNWKMHHNHFDAIALIQKLSFMLDKSDYESVDVSVHPPFTDLRSVQTMLVGDKIPMFLGAQHCHWDLKGAFTGEISPSFLAKLEVTYCIVGHSERREHFGQTDVIVERTLHAILGQGMTPILCVGETREEREAGEMHDKVAGQVRAALHGVAAAQVAGLVIAYEPIWAIGTGLTASSADAQEACAAIRQLVEEVHGAPAAEGVRIQYGGSVKPDNIAELMGQPDIDGALVGGASLEAESFSRIVRYRVG
jgi:triosephosphate isomerase (TIM)